MKTQKNRVIRKSITELARKIAVSYKPEQVILFGSHAWGRPTRSSDVDVLVVKNTRKQKIDRQRDLRAQLYPLRMPVDIVVYTPSELRRKIGIEKNLFLSDIVKNGVVLYEKNKVRKRLV